MVSRIELFRDCICIYDYMIVISRLEGYRSVREFYCNYINNFGYTVEEIKFHVERVHKVFYSIHSHRRIAQLIGVKRRKKAKRKRVKVNSPFTSQKTAEKYERISRKCIGTRSFREGIDYLRGAEGLGLVKIAQLYGVSKSALIYRIKRLERSN